MHKAFRIRLLWAMVLIFLFPAPGTAATPEKVDKAIYEKSYEDVKTTFDDMKSKVDYVADNMAKFQEAIGYLAARHHPGGPEKRHCRHRRPPRQPQRGRHQETDRNGAWASRRSSSSKRSRRPSASSCRITSISGASLKKIRERPLTTCTTSAHRNGISGKAASSTR